MDTQERGVQIRTPATANLMVDSADRVRRQTTRADNFLITKNQSILNGFFNRIGTTEVVVEWNLPNVSPNTNNNTIQVFVTGAPANPYTITLQNNLYTIADALNAIVAGLNALALGSNFTIAASPTGATITSSAATFQFQGGGSNLLGQLGLPDAPGVALTQTANRRLANLQNNIRYLDFVSEQLTYNQELKDDSTNSYQRSVLCRWYMAYDNPVPDDAYGFPILMGYRPFKLRRLFSPAKQIKWNMAQPIGQLSFQVYTDQGGLLTQTYGLFQPQLFEWLMTLQASEN